MSKSWDGGRGCRHKEEEGGESTVGDEGGAQGERGVRPRRRYRSDLIVAGALFLLMRYLGIVWGPGYPREQVGAVLPPTFQRGARAGPSSNSRNCLG